MPPSVVLGGNITDSIATLIRVPWQCFAEELISAVFSFRHNFVVCCISHSVCIHPWSALFIMLLYIFAVCFADVARQSFDKKLMCFIEC